MACAESEHGARDVYAADDAGAANAASAHDIDASDAGPCFSPLRPPLGPLEPLDQHGPGCACDPPPAGQERAYCIQGKALSCDHGNWGVGYDGPCSPFDTWMGLCAKGTRTTAPSCPSGFGSDDGFFNVDGGSPAGRCCVPIEVSAKECTAEGFRVQPAGTQSSLLETRCSDGGMLKAFVPGATPSLCCE